MNYCNIVGWIFSEYGCIGQYSHFTLVWVSWYETKVFRRLTGGQRDTPGFGASQKDTEEKVQIIQQRLKAASDRQNSYADLKMIDIEYEVGDKVFLKVLP